MDAARSVVCIVNLDHDSVLMNRSTLTTAISVGAFADCFARTAIACLGLRRIHRGCLSGPLHIWTTRRGVFCMTSFPLDRLKPLYAFLDPAGPKRRAEGLKNVASRSALIVGGQDDLGRVFVLYAWAARCAANQLMERLHAVYDRFAPKLIGCEENALAGLFTDIVRYDAAVRQRRLPLAGISQPTNIEKDYRIRTTLQPLIANGRIFLLGNDPGMLELKAEITTFPMNHRKDMIDALASLCRMMPLKAVRGGADGERAAYLKYLRESGAPAETIEHEARAWRAVASGLPGGAPST